MARWSPYNVEEDFSMIVTQSSIVVDVSSHCVVHRLEMVMVMGMVVGMVRVMVIMVR